MLVDWRRLEGKTYVTRETAPRTKSPASWVEDTILGGLVVRLEELEILSGIAKSRTQLDLV